MIKVFYDQGIYDDMDRHDIGKIFCLWYKTIYDHGKDKHILPIIINRKIDMIFIYIYIYDQGILTVHFNTGIKINNLFKIDMMIIFCLWLLV